MSVKHLGRGAAALVAVAALAASVTSTPSANGAGGAAARAIAPKLGYHAVVYGARLVTGNVSVANLRDAYAGLPCTTKIGVDRTVSSTASLPANPLIHLSGSTSNTVTYKTATGRRGVRGTNTLGDISVGGVVGGQQTPQLTIQGLQTIADAYNTGGKYGHNETFKLKGMSLTLPQNTPVSGPLQQLLNALQGPSGQVTGAVTTVLQTLGVPLQIPGLGSIALGHKHGGTNSHSANSYSEALVITVTAGGENQQLTLGHSFARVGGPVPGGVFHGDTAALDLQALNGAAHYTMPLGSIPCEGTNGRVVTQRTASASVLGIIPGVPVLDGALMKLTGVTKRHMGLQKRTGYAKGFTQVSIAKAEFPLLQLVITNINARVGVTHKPGQRRVKHTITSSVGSIVSNGKSYPVPAPGKSVALPNGVYLSTAVGGYDPHGAKIRAVKLTIPQVGIVYLGWADTHLNPKG